MHCESKLYFTTNRCSAATLERTMNCKIIDTSQLIHSQPCQFSRDLMYIDMDKQM